jgi:molecular chaperone GrpE
VTSTPKGEPHRPAKSPVRASGPGEGARGNREVPPSPTGPTTAELEQQVKELEAARDSAIADLQRVAADFDNFRKRTARDHQALVARAAEQLVKELLPVLDDLERALEAAHQHEEAKLEEGVRLVHRELSHVLAKEGLVAVETDGQFDPHEHEALLTQPSEAEEGAILEVIQKGYRLGDRVLRPARVVVSAGGEERGDAND